MRPKTGTLLPKEGTLLHRGSGNGSSAVNYPAEIARALRGELGRTRGATKTVMHWTGASERSVKNWFAGAKGPSAEHLLSLAHHSDAVWLAMMVLACRGGPDRAANVAGATGKLKEAVRLLEGGRPLAYESSPP